VEPKKYDCIIIGDEPSGVWFANQYDKQLRQAGIVPQIAWISGPHAASQTSLLIPTLFEKALDIERDSTKNPSFSIQLVTENKVVDWNESYLETFYPSLLAPLKEKEFSQKEDDLSALLTIPDKSELLKITRSSLPVLLWASALWKLVGRSVPLRSETLLHFSRFYARCFWWNAQSQVSPHIERFSVSSWRQGLKKVAREEWEIEGLGTLRSPLWIINLPLSSFIDFTKPVASKFNSSQYQSQACAPFNLYPLNLTTKPGIIPSAVSPACVFLDNDSIADWHTEIWPFECHASDTETKIGLWTTGPRELDLDTILAGLQEGMARLNRKFAYLPWGIQSQEFSLSMESCSSEESREQTLQRLEIQKREIYQMTTSITQSYQTGCVQWTSNINCHLPYPFGTLIEAKKLLKKLVLEKKKIQNKINKKLNRSRPAESTSM
jgi:hypothetical protein